MPYSNTGPFTNNVVPPGISSTFLNNIENFLDTINSAATDSNITSDGSGNLATTGTMQTANNKAYKSKDSGGTVRNLLYMDGSNNACLQAGGANSVSFRTNDGIERARVNSSGLTVVSGTLTAPTIAGATTFSGAVTHNAVLNLILGSLSRISLFSGTATTSATFFNHGLGAVPDFVMIQLNGSSTTAHSIWCEYSSMTSTQCRLTSDGTNAFVGLAIKF